MITISDRFFLHDPGHKCDTARGRLETGQVSRAQDKLQEYLHTQYTTKPPSLSVPLGDLVTCMEMLDHEDDIPAALRNAVWFYTVQISALCEMITALTSFYSKRYARELDVTTGPNVENQIAKIEKVLEILKGNAPKCPPEGPPAKKRKGDKCLDPLSESSKLPTEIVHIIFGYISNPFAASLVSRSWHNEVIEHSNMFRYVVFSHPAGYPEWYRFVKTCRIYGIKCIEEMRLDSPYFTFTNVIKTLDRTELQIHSLYIRGQEASYSPLSDTNGCSFKSFEKLHTLDTDLGLDSRDIFSRLLGRLSALRNVAFIPGDFDLDGADLITFPPLKSFTLSVPQFSSSHVLQFVRQFQFQGVDTMRFVDAVFDPSDLTGVLCRTKPRHVSLMYDHCTSIMFQDLRGMLNTFDSTDISLHLPNVIGSIRDVDWDFPHLHLRELVIRDTEGLYWDWVSRLLRSEEANLTKFVLDQCIHVFDPESLFSFQDVLRYSPALEQLSILSCSRFTNRRCAEFGKALQKYPTKLKTMHLSCEFVSDAGIRSLFANFFSPCLILNLWQASFSEDTIAFLRNHCLHVYHHPEPYKE